MKDIEIQNLSKAYSSRGFALANLTFNTDIKGKIVSVVGPNGAGKTTLIRILSTQLRPTAGKVTLFGLDLFKDVYKIRQRISCLPQEIRPFLYTATPKDYGLTYLRARGFNKNESAERYNYILDRLSISKYKDEEVGKLSGGTIKKVFLSMILAADVDLYFLDEPTTGLDPVSRNRVWSYISEITKQEKKGVVLTSHYMDEISMLSDKVIFLNKGRIIKEGHPKHLLKAICNNVKNKIIVKTASNKEKNIINLMVKEYSDVRINSISGIVYIYASDLSFIEDIFKKHNVKYEISPVTLEDVFLKVVSGNDY